MNGSITGRLGTSAPRTPDRYRSFAELARCEIAGADYSIRMSVSASAALIVAPHGGGIEAGTTELAVHIASGEHNLFTLDGLKARGNRELHISSNRFDHPACLTIARNCAVAIGIHGCRGEGRIYVGGLDTDLMRLLVRRLRRAGLPATTDVPQHLAGRHPFNICNRGSSGRGAQLEITMDMRTPAARRGMALAVRAALTDYGC